MNILWDGRGRLAFGAIVVEADGGRDRTIDQVVSLDRILPIEQVPFIQFLRVGRVKEGCFVDNIEEVKDDREGVLPLVAQQLGKGFVQFL